METKAHQSCVTCPGPESWRIPSQTCLTGKPRFLPHMPHKCLPGGFLEPASPSSQLAQNMGCGPYPSPLSAVSLVLAAPGPAVSGPCPAWLLCHVAPHQALGPEARLGLPWQCPTPGLPRGHHKPLECLRNPTAQASIQTTSPRQPLSLRATGKSFQIVS